MSVYPGLFEIHIIPTKHCSADSLIPVTWDFSLPLLPAPAQHYLSYPPGFTYQKGLIKACLIVTSTPVTNLPSNQEAIHRINMRFFQDSFCRKTGKQESKPRNKDNDSQPGEKSPSLDAWHPGREQRGRLLCVPLDTVRHVGEKKLMSTKKPS